MIVAVDAMGGDNAPRVNIEGAIAAVAERSDIDVVLVGSEEPLRSGLAERGYKGTRISVVPTTEVVAMDEAPSLAVRRKRDSSLRRTVELVRDGKADAAVSAGNSGAMMALALFLLGPAEGVERPAIATAMPTYDGSFLMIDLGANVDCTPKHLLQFAYMGNAYSRHVMGVKNPRVAILSIGEEPAKGNELTKETFGLLQKTDLNFIGNIESKEVFMGHADVVVCDGFVGNIFLKTSEGIADVMTKMLKRELESSILAKLGALLMLPALKGIRKRVDYDEYGGAQLLGLKGACIISHGRASSKAMKNAIFKGADFAAKHLHETISAELKGSPEPAVQVDKS